VAAFCYLDLCLAVYIYICIVTVAAFCYLDLCLAVYIYIVTVAAFCDLGLCLAGSLTCFVHSLS
jgi:hypothetical protein